MKDRILYLEDDFCVVRKKPGEVCERTHKENQVSLPCILQSVVEAELGKKCEIFECVNRLDCPVSGAVLIAHTKSVFSKLTGILHNSRDVTKTYWAIVEKKENMPQTGEKSRIEQYICFNPSKQKAFVKEQETSPGAKWKRAVLEYEANGAGDNYVYLTVNLLTGRTHQIRAQLSSKGMHIKGDVKYGARRADSLPGIRLHAAALSFPHPVTGSIVSVTAALPQTDTLWESFLAAVNEEAQN